MADNVWSHSITPPLSSRASKDSTPGVFRFGVSSSQLQAALHPSHQTSYRLQATFINAFKPPIAQMTTLNVEAITWPLFQLCKAF